MNRMQLAIALLVGTTLAGQAAWAAPGDRPTVHTSKSRFRIPFKFNAADLQALDARQIVLFVSRDRGTNWQQVQSVLPETGKFNFQAPEDGEYWFVVRTLDGKNKLLPDAKINEPELQVVVDSQKPSLKLELRPASASRVQLRWTASDEHLDPTQLRLEYLQPGSETWQNVSIVPKAVGQTEWTVSAAGLVSVRGIVSDLAKNSGQDQVQLRVGGGRAAPPGPDFREPVAQDPPPLRAALPSRDEYSSRFIPASRQPDGTSRGSFASHRSEASNFENLSAQPAGRYKHRVVPAREINIGYRLQDVGPSGVAAVELHVTQDNGATWDKLAEDNDTESPISVRVAREGTYGFAFVVRSGVGLSSDPPQPGEKPEIVVSVDQTPPQVELLPLEQGRGSNLHKILVQWNYDDAFPADKPVALSYAAQPGGPWHPLSGWTENTGRYVWTIDRGVPARFYLRIEARDAAGNTQIAETPDPVLIDLSRPSAKVLDVEPAQP